MVIPIEEGGLHEATKKYGNIIISDTTLRKILPPQVKNMTSWYKVMCGCECWINDKSLYSSLLKWRDCHMEHLKYKIHNVQNSRSGELSSHFYDTYKMQWNRMADTFIVMMQICIWELCVPVSHIILGYHTGNVFYAVVRNAQV